MNRFIAQVIEMAVENVRGGHGGPFAALVVRDGQIVGRGTNRVTTTNDPTAHAEIVAIRDACGTLGDFQLTGCELYSSCEPCPMCMGAIFWARPAGVWYAATRDDAARAGFDDAFIYEQLLARPEARAIPSHWVASPDSSRPFEEWLRIPQRVGY